MARFGVRYEPLNTASTSSAVASEARALARIKPLAKLAAMAMNGELKVIDGMDQIGFLMRWVHGAVGVLVIA
jgi:hypothetical protein